MDKHHISKFHTEGYLIIPQFFPQELMELLKKKCQHDSAIQDSPLIQADSKGRVTKGISWKEKRDDLYGAISCSENLVNIAEALLGGEVYNWHSKIRYKEPEVGGEVEWHQDYPYWYKSGLLRPDALSCMIAIERTNKENACLEVLKGSHKMGRIDLTMRGAENFSKDKLLKALTTFSRGGHNPDVQTGTDPERVEEAIKRYEHVYCELEQGDILFFHSNILHASSANKSKFHRWLLICTYNRFDNEPYKKDCDGTPYSTLHKIAPNDILKIARSEMPTV